MVSPVRGPPGPARLRAPAALVLATWTPQRIEPLSGFRTLADGIDQAVAPAWSPDGTAVYFSSGSETVDKVEVRTGRRK